MKDNTLLDDWFRKIAFNDDQEAFKALFFEFYPSLCVFAERYISSPEMCEDIVQDTFFQIWNNRKKIEVASSFRNLLITSVKNNCTDYLRKQSTRQRYLDKQPGEDYSDSPEEIYTVRELESLLQAALQKLPENSRRAFELSRFGQLTYQQIATEMSVSPKTVEAYISKALGLLREDLKDYLPMLILLYPGFFQ
ncbi:MAG TPA: RNA polymerase sigma-70 factor [Porphyromonadaceae bacterium]|jgi:RNA polymerase sigma-70 factor (ECF subfamily)|uniref:RNA polymerase sigma-70 factor n=1 Tax=Limibacterium fermenti TaxID=3229863 RepID=UPI000E9F0268|nr:RNA polymerase sigma-70 factor [Porphyromonadaceae bacterium]HBL32189.1 RNA polymerase sigma-70 factor [Porphyromonadaceae bacterium]HBX19714.1 RNA polymerase sigma-70 factor [Porphyromonadaceae bacterium]HBX46813.1 RNA polymerase sigma-70 factor [Porphyromonadaceae bacterium]HCM22519.1 RNA polymerase sigma-70 factor [Porphyromonadaceae bacterium]